MLEQVAGELLLERALVALELAAVLAGELDRVLVGHVDPRDRRRLVGVHLLRELAGELDRLHLGAEGTAEHPLDEAFDPGFEIAQNADGGLLGLVESRPPGPGSAGGILRKCRPPTARTGCGGRPPAGARRSAGVRGGSAGGAASQARTGARTGRRSARAAHQIAMPARNRGLRQQGPEDVGQRGGGRLLPAAGRRTEAPRSRSRPSDDLGEADQANPLRRAPTRSRQRPASAASREDGSEAERRRAAAPRPAGSGRARGRRSAGQAGTVTRPRSSAAPGRPAATSQAARPSGGEQIAEPRAQEPGRGDRRDQQVGPGRTGAGRPRSSPPRSGRQAAAAEATSATLAARHSAPARPRGAVGRAGAAGTSRSSSWSSEASIAVPELLERRAQLRVGLEGRRRSPRSAAAGRSGRARPSEGTGVPIERAVAAGVARQVGVHPAPALVEGQGQASRRRSRGPAGPRPPARETCRRACRPPCRWPSARPCRGPGRSRSPSASRAAARRRGRGRSAA